MLSHRQNGSNLFFEYSAHRSTPSLLSPGRHWAVETTTLFFSYLLRLVNFWSQYDGSDNPKVPDFSRQSRTSSTCDCYCFKGSVTRRLISVRQRFTAPHQAELCLACSVNIDQTWPSCWCMEMKSKVVCVYQYRYGAGFCPQSESWRNTARRLISWMPTLTPYDSFEFSFVWVEHSVFYFFCSSFFKQSRISYICRRQQSRTQNRSLRGDGS